MENLTMKCSLNVRKPGIVYATLSDNDGLVLSATLDYCLSVCTERAYIINNAQSVLEWINKNCVVIGD